jgi:hypothetical protein
VLAHCLCHVAGHGKGSGCGGGDDS